MKYKKIFYREKYKKKYLNLNDNTISLPKSCKKKDFIISYNQKL